MAKDKPLIDPATAASIRTEIHLSRDGFVTDRLDMLARAMEALLRAVESDVADEQIEQIEES